MINMKLKLYNKTKQFVIEIFTKTGKECSIKHFIRTVYWIKKLKPKAGEALLISAIAHDIDRGFTEQDEKVKESEKGFLDKGLLSEHQKKSAEIITGFLKKQKAGKKLISKVRMLVSKHEVGGNEEQNLLKDADSISFFENNAMRFVSKKVSEIGKEKIETKFDWTFNRITTKKAKQFALPMYEKAMKKLINNKNN